MKKSRFTEEQVTYALRQAEGGTAVEDVCRSLGNHIPVAHPLCFYMILVLIRKRFTP